MHRRRKIVNILQGKSVESGMKQLYLHVPEYPYTFFLSRIMISKTRAGLGWSDGLAIGRWAIYITKLFYLQFCCIVD